MPARLLFDISGIDLLKVVYDQEAVRQSNPQRGDMEQLNGVIHVDEAAGTMVAFKDVRPDEFWCAGHIPGRPLYPGVLMLESAAQSATFLARRYQGWDGFIGFGAVDEVRFRQPVTPPARLYILVQRLWIRRGTFCCATQGLVNNLVAFEARIVGARM